MNLVLIAGGELLIGNLITLIPTGLSGKIPTMQIAMNLSIIAVSNFAGAVFFACLFRHTLGLTETGPYLARTIAVAKSKMDESIFNGVHLWNLCQLACLCCSPTSICSKRYD